MSLARRTRVAAARALAVVALPAALAAPAFPGDLTVVPAAQYFGGYGLQVALTNTAPAYVEDESPVTERRYRARFYVNLNGLAMASGDEFEIFTGLAPGGTPQFSVLVNRASGQNRLRLAARRDDGTLVETPAGSEVALPREWHAVEIDWRAAATTGSNDGALLLVLDGQNRGGLGGIDNDQAQLGTVRWGAVAGLDAGTSGTFVLDEFDSHRQNYIGMLTVFQDVWLGHPLWRFVHALYNAGVTGGCGNQVYCPDSPASRDQMSIFLLRSREGSQYLPPACSTAPFTDVPVSSPFCRWVRELVNRGVTGGCGNGLYCPSAPVSRAQMAVFLLVTREGSGYQPPACTVAPFNDVPASSAYCRWIRELVNRGITGGCGNGNYCPDAAVTRGQMAVFLSATFGLTVPTL